MHRQVDHLDIRVVQHHGRISARGLDAPASARCRHRGRVDVRARHNLIAEVPVGGQVRAVGDAAAADQPDAIPAAARRLWPVVVRSELQVIQVHARGLGGNLGENATRVARHNCQPTVGDRWGRA